MIRRDDLLNGNFIFQDTEGFLFGMDAVLLAHYPVLRRGDNVLDLCSGNGAVPLIMEPAGRGKGVHFTGLEIQKSAAALAERSVAYNGLGESIRMIQGDVREAARLLPAASFSLVTVNPPYMKGGHGLKGESEARTIARHEVLLTLADVVREGSRMLKMNGRFAMVHRPERLAEIFAGLAGNHLEPKRMRLVYPTAGKAPTMVLIEAVKGGNPGLKAEPPLIVYNEDRSYTKELLTIYGMTEEAK